MKPIQVGLLGIGTVGSGVFNVLKRNQAEIKRRAGRGIEVTMVADLDTARASFTTCAAPPTTDCARLVSRSATTVISIPRPARRLISSWLRLSTLKTPLPTVPMPSRPT